MRSSAPRAFTSYDTLKLIALMTMTVDHIGGYLYPDLVWLRVIGRAAAPIFCFLVGWNGQYRFRTSLLIAAMLVSAGQALYGAAYPLNILWTILFGRMLMAWLDKRAGKESAWMMVLAMMLWAPVMGIAMDYGMIAMLWMLWGRQHRRDPDSRESQIYALAAFTGSMLLMLTLLPFSLLQASAALAILVMVVLLLRGFVLRERPNIHAPVRIFWSRHAMEYYVLHLTVIFALAIWLRLSDSGSLTGAIGALLAF